MQTFTPERKEDATMYNESALLSPEDVACYEECVTDEIYIPSPSTSSHHGIPKAQSSGRITKRSEFCFCFSSASVSCGVYVRSVRMSGRG